MRKDHRTSGDRCEVVGCVSHCLFHSDPPFKNRVMGFLKFAGLAVVSPVLFPIIHDRMTECVILRIL